MLDLSVQAGNNDPILQHPKSWQTTLLDCWIRESTSTSSQTRHFLGHVMTLGRLSQWRAHESACSSLEIVLSEAPFQFHLAGGSSLADVDSCTSDFMLPFSRYAKPKTVKENQKALGT